MDPGIFNWERGRGVGSERPVELFCGKLLLTETTTCFSTCERRSPLAPQVLLCEQKRKDHRRVPKTMTFLNPCGYGAFIKKEKKSVIYDSVDEELQLQTSVRSDGVGGGGDSDPPRPPWIRHWLRKIFNV